MSKTCQTCGGLVLEYRGSYGYSGKICQGCPKPEAPTVNWGPVHAQPPKDSARVICKLTGDYHADTNALIAAYEKLEQRLEQVKADAGKLACAFAAESEILNARYDASAVTRRNLERELAEEKTRSVAFLEQFEADIRKSERARTAGLVEALKVIEGRGWTGSSPADYKSGVAREALKKWGGET